MESNLQPSVNRPDALTTELRETCGELGDLLGSYMTRVLHTAGINNVESVMCDVMCDASCVINKERWMKDERLPRYV